MTAPSYAVSASFQQCLPGRIVLVPALPPRILPDERALAPDHGAQTP